jgi:hypothetical protein
MQAEGNWYSSMSNQHGRRQPWPNTHAQRYWSAASERSKGWVFRVLVIAMLGEFMHLIWR